MRVALLSLAVSLAALPARADGTDAADAARSDLCTLLTRLANAARAEGDATAAQALAETVSFVGGVPHAHLDAIRSEVVRRFGSERRWTFDAGDDWRAVRGHVAQLAASPHEHDRIDAELIRGLPDAIEVTRVLSRIRFQAGLKAMRYDGKRSAKNVALSRKGAIPPARDGAPRMMFASAGHRWDVIGAALADVAFRAALFDPADKGVTWGTWTSPKTRHPGVVGLSGNRRLFPKQPGWVAYPPPGRMDLPVSLLLRATPAGAVPPISVHFFGPRPSLASARVALREARDTDVPCSLAFHVLGDQHVVRIQPARPLRASTQYGATVTGADGTVLAQWSFETR